MRQETTLRLTELERRLHDSNMWEGKYEQLLKAHNATNAELYAKVAEAYEARCRNCWSPDPAKVASAGQKRAEALGA